MPSRNDYYYVSRDDPPSMRVMDMSNVQNGQDIRLAINLCRIVLRALEFSAFQTLQRAVNDLPKKKPTKEYMEMLLQPLIKLLFSLRWRVAWWTVFGITANPEGDQALAPIDQVTAISRTLYFWYWVVRKKLAGERLTTARGVWNTYADAATAVLDDFPLEDSLEGFDAWMAHGRRLVREAYVQPVVPQPLLAS